MVKNILAVGFDDETGLYSVNIPEGSSVAETAFGVSVIIKCLVRDKVIEDNKVFIDMMNKYLTESQYQEIEEVENDEP